MPNVLVLDTCVLISAVLRTLLLQLAQQGWFAPVWSAIIGDEWRRTARHLWRTDAADIAAQWSALQQAFPQADMGDVSALKNGLRYSDPKDWHVIAAARAAATHYPDARVAIVTRNIKDFHKTELRRLGIALFDPDRLASSLWTNDPLAMHAELCTLPERAHVPGRPPETLQAMLRRERLFRLSRLCEGKA